MITVEDWVTIRNLKNHNPDLGTRKIAKLLNVSRNTVKSALKKDSAPQYTRECSANPFLMPFEEYISESLNKKRLRKSRVLADIRAKGYTGSQSAFYRYCEKMSAQEKPSFKPYETSPGFQAQYDWSPYTVMIGGKLVKLYVYQYIHGFSRHRVLEAALSDTMASILEALENSIIESGGVCEQIQTDNATSFVTNASKDNFQWNKRYLAFCGHYGFKPTRSLPAHPWSKGKVERPFAYLEDHFIKGNEYESFEDFCQKLKDFQDKVNSRVHSTTKAKPIELFAKEKEYLSILPESRYVSVKEEVRKVSADCLISFMGCRYSVPYLFVGKQVWVKVSKGSYIEVYSTKSKLIARHKLSLEKGKIIMLDSHYKNHSIEKGSWKRLAMSFSKKFPDFAWFLDKLYAQKRINPAYHLTRIMDTAMYFEHKDMEAAFLKCRDYNIFNSKFVRAYVENNAKDAPVEPVRIETMINKPIEEVNIVRNLDYYNNHFGG